MVVPESPNNQPELPNEKGAEAQAASSLRQDGLNSVNFNDLNNVFGPGQDNSDLPDLTFNEGASSDKSASSLGDKLDGEIMPELEGAVSEQRLYVNNLESQIRSVTQAAEAASIKQQADKLKEADDYLTSMA